jgi:hypothetical protein
MPPKWRNALGIVSNGHLIEMAVPESRYRRKIPITAASGSACLVMLLSAGCAEARLSRSANVSRGRPHVLVSNAHRSAATLDVVSGTTSVDVSAGTRPGLLYRVRTAAGSGVRPLATLDGHTLRVGQTGNSVHIGVHTGVPTIDVQLARGVRWTVNLDGGAATETVNMEKGSLTSLSFGAGVSMASVRLPAPVGTLTVTLAGGATQLLVAAPAGAPAEVKVVGGASQVGLDGVSHTGVAGGSVFWEPGWASSHNRYAVDLLAGVSEFLMSRN